MAQTPTKPPRYRTASPAGKRCFTSSTQANPTISIAQTVARKKPNIGGTAKGLSVG